ncbi:hypothetical protein ES703_73669 [subsurface metagenome]
MGTAPPPLVLIELIQTHIGADPVVSCRVFNQAINIIIAYAVNIVIFTDGNYQVITQTAKIILLIFIMSKKGNPPAMFKSPVLSTR